LLNYALLSLKEYNTREFYQLLEHTIPVLVTPMSDIVINVSWHFGGLVAVFFEPFFSLGFQVEHLDSFADAALFIGLSLQVLVDHFSKRRAQ
jgi:hypothetical protein